ncbi:MAG TPA: EAL domain-containing protein, partial [Rhodospirillaceae bacterium]|nr:EAL domain-containing protein [Rhodospirillaceae bacterium]
TPAMGMGLLVTALIEERREARKAVAARTLAEEEVVRLAYHDPLTKLPNRLLIQDRFRQAIAYAERESCKLALLSLDLDKFKTINESLGHGLGDELICEVALRLISCVRDTDTVGRQGGDEFLVVLSAIKDVDVIAPVLMKIIERLREPCHIGGYDLHTSVSVGIALFPDDGPDFDILLKKADTALSRAKDAGGNVYQFFDEQMNVDAIERLDLSNGIRRALDQKEFILHYQPQIDILTGRVIGAEALIRWQHPEIGMIPPGRFIPIAEEGLLIVPIGEWVLGEACRQAVAWRKAGLPELVVAVNVSAGQFKRGNVEETVIKVLKETGHNPACLELELTESVLLQDVDIVMATVKRLKTLGVKLSIDDFGTGYSSLSYLKRLDVDKLKIDQSFVRDMAVDPANLAIVHAVVQMAHSLNLKTIAEGVEDIGAANQLRNLGCDEVQGFYFSRPLIESDFARFLAQHS